MNSLSRHGRKRARCSLATSVAVAVLAALGGFAAVATHGSVHFARAATFRPGAGARRWSDFDEVFRDGARVKLCTLATGRVYVPRSEMLRRDHSTFDRAEEHSPLPIYAHLVRHPVHGDVLVDTGLDASFVHDPLGNFGPAARLVHSGFGARFELEPGADIVSQLERLGASPRIAFFTHVHGDHTAGIPALARSMRLVVGGTEASDVAAYLGYGHVTSERTVESIDFRRARGIGPFAHVVDLFGDGSVLALATPGHSTGHTSYLVNAESGPVLLIGDAAHTRWSFAHDIGPRGPTESYDMVGQGSLDAISEFARQHPLVKLVFGHESPELSCEVTRSRSATR